MYIYVSAEDIFSIYMYLKREGTRLTTEASEDLVAGTAADADLAGVLLFVGALPVCVCVCVCVCVYTYIHTCTYTYYTHPHPPKHLPAAAGPLSLSGESAVAGPKIPVHVAPDNGRPSAGPPCPPPRGGLLVRGRVRVRRIAGGTAKYPAWKGGLGFRI